MAVLMDEREQVIRDLTRHCGDGRLTLDELEDRIREAYAATTPDDLRHVLRDLPVSASEPLDAESPEPPIPTVPPAPAAPSAPWPPAAPTPPAPWAPVPARPSRTSDVEKALCTLITIGGFVLLFNGMFWLALICWFVLPGLIIRHRST
jgi:uncharacterized membrane protein